MKVLAISNVFGRPWQPIRGPYNQIIFNELNKRHELSVLVPVSFVDVFKYFSRYLRVQSTTAVQWPYAKYFIYWYIPGVSQSVNAYFMFFSLAVSYPRLVFIQKWDVVFGSWLYPDCVVANWIGRIRSIPSIAHAIGSDVNVVAFKPLQRNQILRFLNGCYRVLTVSADLGKKLAALGIQEAILRTVYNGVDGAVFERKDKNLARQSLQLPLDRKQITFVGSLFREKGCLELLSAFGKLDPIARKLSLVFVGEGGMLAALKSEAERLGILSHVLFAGRVLHGDLGPWFAASDITCLPSYMEGVPNVIMESMSCGVPVVASNVGGIPEVLDPVAGVMVEPRDAEGLAVALNDALNRSWDAAAIRAHVSQYTWNDTVEQIEAIMHEAISSNN
jgi:glycosyltransferase involved in cell wall biosynthesis